MKKIVGTLLTLILTLSMSVTAFATTENNKVANAKSTTITDGVDLANLKIGETVKVPIKIKNAPIGVMGAVIPMGDAGYIDFTRRVDNMEYVMHIKPFHTKIDCYAEIMDITHGVSRGSSPIALESGTIPYVPYKGQQYSLTINGYAYVLDKPCVSIYAKVFWVN